MRGLALLLVALVGCYESDLRQCADGRVCPAGTTCDDVNATCVDEKGLVLPEGDIDFGSLACGNSAMLAVPLVNPGLVPLEFTTRATLAGVTITPASGTIDPGGVIELAIMANPGGGTIPGVAVVGSITVSTSYEVLERTVRLTTSGAFVSADPIVDFGEKTLASSSLRTFRLHNGGNLATDLAIASPSAPFSISTAGPYHIEPGADLDVDVVFGPAALIQIYQASAALTFSGVQCQPPPANVELRGVVSDEPILASSTLIDFGTESCPSLMEQRTLSFTSQLPGDQALTFTLTGSDAVEFVVPSSLALPAGQTRGILIARLPLSAPEIVGPKSATLTVMASPSGIIKEIELVYAISAPVLFIEETNLNFGNVPNGSIGSMMIAVNNNGNTIATASVSPPSVSNGTSAITTSLTSPFIGAGGSTFLTIDVIGGDAPIPPTMFSVSAPGQCSQSPAFIVAAIFTL